MNIHRFMNSKRSIRVLIMSKNRNLSKWHSCPTCKGSIIGPTYLPYLLYVIWHWIPCFKSINKNAVLEGMKDTEAVLDRLAGCDAPHIFIKIREIVSIFSRSPCWPVDAWMLGFHFMDSGCTPKQFNSPGIFSHSDVEIYSHHKATCDDTSVFHMLYYGTGL